MKGSNYILVVTQNSLPSKWNRHSFYFLSVVHDYLALFFLDEEKDLNNRAHNQPNWKVQPYSSKFIAVLIFLYCTISKYLRSVSAEHSNVSGTVEGIS